MTTSSDVVGAEAGRLDRWQELLATESVEGLQPSLLIADVLHGFGRTYFGLVDEASLRISHQQNTREVHVPGLALVAWAPSLVIDDGQLAFGTGEFTIDVQQLGLAGISRQSGLLDADFPSMVGPFSSAAESAVFDAALGVDAASTATVITAALEQGIPLLRIDQANVDRLLPQLVATDLVRSSVAEAVVNGGVVAIPQGPVTINDWVGTGWIQVDDGGGFGYLLSGGLNGGATTGSSPAIDDLTSVNTTMTFSTAGNITELLDDAKVPKATVQGLGSAVNIIGAHEVAKEAALDAYDQHGNEDAALLSGLAAGSTNLAGSMVIGEAAGILLAEVIVLETLPLIAGVVVIGGLIYLASKGLEQVSRASGQIVSDIAVPDQ